MRKIWIGTCTVAALWAQAGRAQTGGAQATDATAPTASADAYGVADIIVTAQKRAQKLNDVGISIVAASGAQLVASGVSDVSQLAKVAPGFSVGNTYAGYEVFSIRGVNFNAGQFSAPPAVTTYVDEAIIPYSAMTGGLLLDVDHVEVLKGPQGTLFGTNSTGGSINVVAAKPTSTLKAGAGAEVNQFGQVKLDGYLSGPLTDTVRARLAVATTQFGAWQKGYYLSDRKNGDQNRGAARLLIDWDATSRLRISLNLNANYDHGEAIQAQFGNYSPLGAPLLPGLALYPAPRDNRNVEIDPNLDTHMHNRLLQGVLRLEYELNDNLTFTSITNYIDFKSSQFRDGDGTVFDNIHYHTIGNDKSFNQEIRLNGKTPTGALTYIVGASYSKDKILDGTTDYFTAYSALPPNSMFDLNAHIRTRSTGVFGNIEYAITPAISVLGGLRYTWNRQSLFGCFTGDAAGSAVLGFIANSARGAAGLPTTDAYAAGGCLTINDVPATPGGTPDYLPYFPNLERNEHNLSWRAGINVKPDRDKLIYALVSRGFKAGLFPVTIPLLRTQVADVKQEELTSYEVGAKLGLFDRAVQLNVSGFYYDYRDKQFFTYQPLAVVGYASVLVNVPKSKVKGFDIDLSVTPLSGLTFRAAATYVKTEVGAFQTFTSLGKANDATGTEFNFAPPWSGSFDGQYQFPVGDGLSALAGGGGQFNSRTYSNLGETPESRIPGYVTFDARIGLESDKGWRIGAFVRNLTNKYYYTAVFPSADTNGRFAGLPRTYGVNARFTF